MPIQHIFYQVKVSIFEPTELINGTAAVENTFKYSPADENSSGVSCQLMKLPSNIPAGSAIVEVGGSDHAVFFIEYCCFR